MITTKPGVCTIFHGAGAPSIFGTPCGRQLASGSSSRMRSIGSRIVQRFRPRQERHVFRFQIHRKVTSILVRVRLPDAGEIGMTIGGPRRRRCRSGFPSAVFGMPLLGRLCHCAPTGAQQTEVTATRQSRRLVCAYALRLGRLYTRDYIDKGRRLRAQPLPRLSPPRSTAGVTRQPIRFIVVSWGSLACRRFQQLCFRSTSMTCVEPPVGTLWKTIEFCE